LETLRKRALSLTNKKVACYKKQCGKERERLSTLFEEKRKPCESLKEYALGSTRFMKSPYMKCILNINHNVPEIKKVAKQADTCEHTKCKQENEQSDLLYKQVINATEQKNKYSTTIP
jgi:hypothetical protein